jgi:hypothetical protein
MVTELVKQRGEELMRARSLFAKLADHLVTVRLTGDAESFQENVPVPYSA